MWRKDSSVDIGDFPLEFRWTNSSMDTDIIAYRLTGRVLDGWAL